jgi:hypothetical protein
MMSNDQTNSVACAASQCPLAGIVAAAFDVAFAMPIAVPSCLTGCATYKWRLKAALAPAAGV